MNRETLKSTMQTHALDVIVSLATQTRLWYAGINTSAGWLFIEPDRADLIIDGRYIEHARSAAQHVTVHLLLAGTLKVFAKTKTYRRIGVESEYLTLAQLGKIKKLFPDATIVKVSGQALRAVKTGVEITYLKQACALALAALARIEPLIKPGVTEQMLDHQLNLAMKELGADKESFDAVIVSGPRGALPHGRPSLKKLQAGELVTIDFGAFYRGYASDITRTFKVGTVTDPQLNAIFEVVKTAQQMGIKAVKPGVRLSTIDRICRDYIRAQGYGKYFVHATGHGLGIDVHELPVVARHSSTVLEPGMVITVEPGIYIEGVGGVRFEDDVLVTSDGFEVLSMPPHDKIAKIADSGRASDQR